MKWVMNDGGRDKYFRGWAPGDCFTRAAAIASENDYRDIYELVNSYCAKEKEKDSNYMKNFSARLGVEFTMIEKIMKDLGWQYHSLPEDEQDKYQLNELVFPKGRVMVNLQTHCTAVINGVIQDAFDPNTRDGCLVDGYYTKDPTMATAATVGRATAGRTARKKHKKTNKKKSQNK